MGKSKSEPTVGETTEISQEIDLGGPEVVSLDTPTSKTNSPSEKRPSPGTTEVPLDQPSEKKARLGGTEGQKTPLFTGQFDDVNPRNVINTKRNFAAKSTGPRSRKKIKTEVSMVEQPDMQNNGPDNVAASTEVPTPHKRTKKLFARKSGGPRKSINIENVPNATTDKAIDATDEIVEDSDNNNPEESNMVVRKKSLRRLSSSMANKDEIGNNNE